MVRQVSAPAPAASAKLAGLRYVSDRLPGIRRIRAGKGFRYVNHHGRLIRDPHTLRRIQSLAIPPAWRDVWISPIENAHLQAVGRDARGRKQYRYHPRWRGVRDETKFHRMISFGKALTKIRRQVGKDLRSSELTRRKVLATIVRLLETTYIRVGNDEYVRENNSFGLTTLRDRHVNVAGDKVHFYFRGKSGVKHAISLEDSHLSGIVKRLRDLPGYELFQYVDDNGQRRPIGSEDVNQYLREISGEDFSSKDFRTWAGTVLAAVALSQNADFKSTARARRNVNTAVAGVAEQLGNTAAVCRKCYIHPAVIDAYMDQSLHGMLRISKRVARLRPEESAILCLLEKRMKQQARRRVEPLERILARSIKKVRRKRSRR
jgi:DNA topoisomerase-1